MTTISSRAVATAFASLLLMGSAFAQTPAPAPATPAPADSRPAADQVKDIRQTMSDAGVKSDNPPLSEEKNSRVESALASAKQSGQDTPSPDNSPSV